MMGRASRYETVFWLSFPPSTMTKAQEFTVKVPAEDPEKKEKPDDKPNFEGSSRLLKDAKDGEGEELVIN